MFFTYLRRELTNRKRQTFIVSLGLALAIAVVLVVSSLSNGAKQAQSQVLGALYGIGTDVTVTQTAAPPTPGQDGNRQRFDIPGGQSGSSTDSASRQIDRTNLRVDRGAATLDDAAVQSVSQVAGVSSVATSLRLENVTFQGELPQVQQGQSSSGQAGEAAPGAGQSGPQTLGNSSFSVDSFSVMGIGTGDATGPLSGTVVADGRGLDASDAGQHNAVVDATYASSAGLSVGSTVTLGAADGTTQDMSVVGLITSSTSAAETAADVYIPLDVAQTLSGETGVTDIYVAATSGATTSSVADGIKAALPDATVSTTADLGSAVSGSLSTATDLLTNLGKWLAVLVLVAAFGIAVLFTISGVTRRTREFGTLRALGWRKSRIVGQVGGESLVQGLLGGAIGLALGFAVVRIIDAVAPSLDATAGGLSGFGGAFAGGRFGQGPGGGGGATPFAGGARPPGAQAATTFQVALKAVLTPGVLLAAVGLAILGGVIAGVFGGWRASRLRPADALRSVG